MEMYVKTTVRATNHPQIREKNIGKFERSFCLSNLIGYWTRPPTCLYIFEYTCHPFSFTPKLTIAITEQPGDIHHQLDHFKLLYF